MNEFENFIISAIGKPVPNMIIIKKYGLADDSGNIVSPDGSQGGRCAMWFTQISKEGQEGPLKISWPVQTAKSPCLKPEYTLVTITTHSESTYSSVLHTNTVSKFTDFVYKHGALKMGKQQVGAGYKQYAQDNPDDAEPWYVHEKKRKTPPPLPGQS